MYLVVPVFSQYTSIVFNPNGWYLSKLITIGCQVLGFSKFVCVCMRVCVCVCVYGNTFWFAIPALSFPLDISLFLSLFVIDLYFFDWMSGSLCGVPRCSQGRLPPLCMVQVVLPQLLRLQGHKDLDYAKWMCAHRCQCPCWSSQVKLLPWSRTVWLDPNTTHKNVWLHFTLSHTDEYFYSISVQKRINYI
jgi:hypothetical protein